MNLPLTAPLKTESADQDIAEQAHPGQGVPSQDPDSAAQFALKPKEAEREAKSALIGGGVVAGAATGAALGAVIAGPVGVVVGGTLGTVAGALGAAAAGTVMVPTDSGKAAPAPADTVRVPTEDSAGGDGRG